ncbi:hypothetical protein M514_01461 [Trichuris suis]|uniref:Small ribosomal subunit protein uS10 n=1 Tax=Trichuris suis TaxID=68888 RepID=A0A085N7N8_9BILA|nr:hypothetical protein M514_01461 [Trichuris suis]
MAYLKKEVQDEADMQPKKIQVALTSCNVPALERACAELIKSARDNDVKVKGPIRFPTKILRITCRKTPCGEGSKTWDRYEMRIHKRTVRMMTSLEKLKELTKLPIEPVVKKLQFGLLCLPIELTTMTTFVLRRRREQPNASLAMQNDFRLRWSTHGMSEEQQSVHHAMATLRFEGKSLLEVELLSDSGNDCTSVAERRRIHRASLPYRQAHASRERLRVESFNRAFQELRTLLPVLPPDKKMTKVQILRLAASYITYLNCLLNYDRY